MELKSGGDLLGVVAVAAGVEHQMARVLGDLGAVQQARGSNLIRIAANAGVLEVALRVAPVGKVLGDGLALLADKIFVLFDGNRLSDDHLLLAGLLKDRDQLLYAVFDVEVVAINIFKLSASAAFQGLEQVQGELVRRQVVTCAFAPEFYVFLPLA